MIKRALFFVNWTFAIAMCLAWLSQYVDPCLVWVMSLFGLVFPYLFLINLVFAIWWLFFLDRRIWLSTLVLVLSWNQIVRLIPFANKDQGPSDQTEIKVMSYNVRLFNRYQRWIKRHGISNEIDTLIKNNLPDILCFQEYEINRDYYIKTFPHHFSLPRFKVEPKSHSAIFSRFPLLNKGLIEFTESLQYAMYADVALPSDTIRLYNIHLQSFKVSDYRWNDKKEWAKEILNNLELGFKKHSEQIDMVNDHIKKSPYPVLICADLNSTPFSYVYHELINGFQDTFVEKGSGIGTTFHFNKIPFRIDFILADSSFVVSSHKVIRKPLSDHYPVVSKLELKP